MMSRVGLEGFEVFVMRWKWCGEKGGCDEVVILNGSGRLWWEQWLVTNWEKVKTFGASWVLCLKYDDRWRFVEWTWNFQVVICLTDRICRPVAFSTRHTKRIEHCPITRLQTSQENDRLGYWINLSGSQGQDQGSASITWPADCQPLGKALISVPIAAVHVFCWEIWRCSWPDSIIVEAVTKRKNREKIMEDGWEYIRWRHARSLNRIIRPHSQTVAVILDNTCHD